MTRPALGDMIRRIARDAANSDEKFLVVKNHHGLPDVNVGSDVDILVRPNRMRHWHELLVRACRSFGATVERARCYFYSQQHIIHGLDTGSLQIDLMPRLHWRGGDWLDMHEVHGRAVRFREDLWIPHPADECVITFCLSYLHGGFVKTRYLPLLSRLAAAHDHEVSKQLKRIFGDRGGAEIVEELRLENLAGLHRRATSRRIRVLLRALARKPVHSITTMALGYAMEALITAEQAESSNEARNRTATRAA